MPKASEVIDKALSTVLAKLTSARFIGAIVSMSTMCFIAYKSLSMVSSGELSKEIFFAVFTGFSTIVGSIITFYFTKERHEDKENKQ